MGFEADAGDHLGTLTVFKSKFQAGNREKYEITSKSLQRVTARTLMDIAAALKCSWAWRWARAGVQSRKLTKEMADRVTDSR